MRGPIDNYSNVKRGSDAPRAKLSDEDVLLIRALREEGMQELSRVKSYCSLNALAEKFGVHRRTIEKILYRDTWSHI